MAVELLFSSPCSSSRSMVSLATGEITSAVGLTRLTSMIASSIGLSTSQGALYSALFNIASGIGRLAYGFLADYAVGVRR
jgi:hypothetical protein